MGKRKEREGKGRREKEGVYKKGCRKGKYRNSVKMGNIMMIFTDFRTKIEIIKNLQKSTCVTS